MRIDAGGEDHRRRDPGRGRPLELDLKGGVGHRQHHQVDRPGDVGQGRVAGEPGNLPVPGVDQVDRPPVPAGEELADQLVPERPGPGARPDHGERPRLEQGGEARAGHRRRLAARLRSARMASTACQPGMPQTPPPPWVAELAW